MPALVVPHPHTCRRCSRITFCLRRICQRRVLVLCAGCRRAAGLPERLRRPRTIEPEEDCVHGDA